MIEAPNECAQSNSLGRYSFSARLLFPPLPIGSASISFFGLYCKPCPLHKRFVFSIIVVVFFVFWDHLVSSLPRVKDAWKTIYPSLNTSLTLYMVTSAEGFMDSRLIILYDPPLLNIIISPQRESHTGASSTLRTQPASSKLFSKFVFNFIRLKSF